MNDYKDLKVWQKSHELTLDIYKITKDFPSGERFGLTSQLRRASASIPTNIVEGYGQLTKVNYIRFLGVARGSSLEVEYLLRLCKDLDYISDVDYNSMHNQNLIISKMLNALINSLKKNT